MYTPLKNLQDLGKFELEEGALVLRNSELLREKVRKKYSKLSEIVLSKPDRFNACVYEVVEDRQIKVNLGFRYASTISSRPFFEYGGESFDIKFDNKESLIKEIELALRHRALRAVILKKDRDVGSIIGHSFPF